MSGGEVLLFIFEIKRRRHGPVKNRNHRTISRARRRLMVGIIEPGLYPIVEYELGAAYVAFKPLAKTKSFFA